MGVLDSIIQGVVEAFVSTTYMCAIGCVGLTVVLVLFVVVVTWDEIATANRIARYREAATPSDTGSQRTPVCGDVAVVIDRPAVPERPAPRVLAKRPVLHR